MTQDLTGLAFSDELTLPAGAATEVFGFIGRRGSGKTFAAGKLTELLLDAGVQVVILDLVGNWWGLRLAADGTGPGFEIPVLGGLRGDIPLEAGAGELIADLVVETGQPLILDLSQFSKADRKRFATAFGERLWQAKKAEQTPSPLHLVIEESQLLIPQNVTSGDARMVGIYEEIVRLGRNYGIGVSLISQRPQSVNKEVLTQTECLVVLQVNGTPERKALREWIVDQGLDVNLLTELPGLPVGTAYVWSPQWLRILQKVKIARKRTFDASATPRVGEVRTRQAMAPLDLDVLRTRMADLVESAEANDPKALRRRITELERSLGQHTPEVRVERVEVPILDADLVGRLETVARDLAQLGAQTLGLADTVVQALKSAATPVQTVPAAPALAATPSRPHLSRTGVPRMVQERKDATAGTLTAPQQRILDALAAYEMVGIPDPLRSNVAVWADQSPKSSGFTNNLGSLRTAGLIDYPSGGRVSLTDQGRPLATPSAPIGSLTDLHAAWYSRLPGPQARILKVLVDVYPASFERAVLAEAAGQSPTSSGFSNNLGALRTLGLVDYPERGSVAATGLLFPEGLARLAMARRGSAE